MNVLSQLLPYVPPTWRTRIANIGAANLRMLCEIRLRVGRAAMAVLSDNRQLFIGPDGLTADAGRGFTFTRAHADQLLHSLSEGSLYALEEQLRHGYLTLRGGHRVGFSGEAVMRDGTLRTLVHVGGFNIRIARAFIGCARRLLPQLVGPGMTVHSTLIVSPPGAGKTTLLRDVARSLSYGLPWNGEFGVTVAIVDERSEIAACERGVPMHDVGPRTDVVDKAPKAAGMLQMLRSMSPAVVITDEIGRSEDVSAMMEALHAGVSVIASVHGASWDDVRARPGLQPLVKAGAFSRIVLLSNRQGPGTIETVSRLQRATSPKHKSSHLPVHMA